MSSWRWHGLDHNGKNHKGTLEAATEAGARQQLRARGVLVLDLQAQPAGEGSSRLRRLPIAARVLFTRQLATLVSAAIPLEGALQAIARQSENPALARLVSQLKARITEGYSLHEALSAWPQLFDKLYCTLVMAGEKTGRLGEVLEKLADYVESRQQLRARLIQALIYPVALTVVAIGVTLILLTAVVPQVIDQFVQMKQTLPATTSLLLAISDAVQTGWMPTLLIIAAGTLAFRCWLRRPTNQLRFHRWQVHRSPLRRLLKALNAARYLRTLSILQSSHVPLLEAMEIARAVNRNGYVSQALSEAAAKVRQGLSLHAALEQTDLFPQMMLYMIASGEQSGELSALMARAAENQEQQLQHRIALALALFEPALIVTMASIVLFIVLAVLQPILQLNNLVS